ncbi:MAG: ATP-binding protein [Candidatus Aminicenantes bacterium]|nr:ATP-binding protein [Candidatus Aminicenantes bacterium]MDH5385309.1 ATP-binding protein [Candidatus Aminicenantes bacterium]
MAGHPCVQCNDTGWILKGSKGSLVARRCNCFEKRKSEILLEQARIPKRYQNCSFKNFEPEHDDSLRHALKIAKQFVKNYPVQDIGLLLIGPCGVGKTHLAVATISELIQQKSVLCYFCDFRELIRRIQNTYSPDSPLTESNILEPIFYKDVLVLDELGAKRTTAWVEETIFYIVNYRYNNKKLTVLTSNYPDHPDDEEDFRVEHFKKGEKGEETLVDRIGVRLRSRLYEMCKIVKMEGEDYRKKIKQASYRF